jgi:hypothetical protein
LATSEKPDLFTSLIIMIAMNQLDRINYYNILAMLLASCLAIFIPFELTLLSYAILGPAHYLTEISWLKGRQFFTIKKNDYLIILIAVIVAVVIRLPFENILFYTFGLSFVLLVISDNRYRLIAGLLLIFAGYFLLSNNIMRTIFGLYLATLIHVYVFTGMFILHGALKNKSFSGYLSLILFIACPVLLFTVFIDYHNTPAGWVMSGYKTFARLNITTLRNHSINIYFDWTSVLLTRFIAFAYTYHYLNWFSKTRIINWHQVSLKRATIIIVIWAASVALYFYNYNIGLKWLFVLSLSHVILEFPLNHRTFIGIGRELKHRLPFPSAK